MEPYWGQNETGSVEEEREGVSEWASRKPTLRKSGNAGLLRWRARVLWAVEELGSTWDKRLWRTRGLAFTFLHGTNLPEQAVPQHENTSSPRTFKTSSSSHRSKCLESSHFPHQEVYLLPEHAALQTYEATSKSRNGKAVWSGEENPKTVVFKGALEFPLPHEEF